LTKKIDPFSVVDLKFTVNEGNDQLFGGDGNDRLDGGGMTDSGDGGADFDTCINVENAQNCEA